MQSDEQRAPKRQRSSSKAAADTQRDPDIVILVLDDTKELTDKKSIEEYSTKTADHQWPYDCRTVIRMKLDALMALLESDCFEATAPTVRGFGFGCTPESLRGLIRSAGGLCTCFKHLTRSEFMLMDALFGPTLNKFTINEVIWHMWREDERAELKAKFISKMLYHGLPVLPIQGFSERMDYFYGYCESRCIMRHTATAEPWIPPKSVNEDVHNYYEWQEVKYQDYHDQTSLDHYEITDAELRKAGWSLVNTSIDGTLVVSIYRRPKQFVYFVSYVEDPQGSE